MFSAHLPRYVGGVRGTLGIPAVGPPPLPVRYPEEVSIFRLLLGKDPYSRRVVSAGNSMT